MHFSRYPKKMNYLREVYSLLAQTVHIENIRLDFKIAILLLLRSGDLLYFFSAFPYFVSSTTTYAYIIRYYNPLVKITTQIFIPLMVFVLIS